MSNKFFSLLFTALFLAVPWVPLSAEIAEDTPENSFEERIVKTYEKSSDLFNSGLREVRETLITNGALVAYEATDGLVDGQELLDEVVAWLPMYTTEVGRDIPGFNKIKTFLKEKQQLAGKLVNAVGARTSDVNAVLRIKKGMKSLDKKIAFQFKALKGKIKLIPNKPLPAEAQK